jgi:hypothetical protein
VSNAIAVAGMEPSLDLAQVPWSEKLPSGALSQQALRQFSHPLQGTSPGHIQHTLRVTTGPLCSPLTYAMLKEATWWASPRHSGLQFGTQKGHGTSSAEFLAIP